ncbi:MAG: EAL domain-containing protein [Candidatus Omnitrophica bacterium]|nr:EAL domain-containing protein [Candidatus Omnitrophota bacterium]
MKKSLIIGRLSGSNALYLIYNIESIDHGMGNNTDNKKNILLVDDDKSVTEMLSMLLEMRGYHVRVASTGHEAIEVASNTTDLIILDLVLPDQEGFSVCRKLKEKKETTCIPIIILSAKLLSEDIVEGLYLGADDYLTKPFEYEELVARMEAVMRRVSVFREDQKTALDQDVIERELRRIVTEELIVPFFQPIFLLDSPRLLGLEALTRPRKSCIFVNPELLFKAAIQFGFYQELEMLAWRKALAYASKYLKEEKIFLNCNPYLVEGQKLLTVKSIFDKTHVPIDNVVLEITGRSAVSNYQIFYNHLNEYRQQGFQFAVDDVGGGYASLETIVQIKPEVVKIDRHIISHINEDEFKQSIVKFVVAFCKDNKILSIAEGVETKEELVTIKHLGIDAAQGYYLHNPVPRIDFAEMNQSLKKVDAR